MQTLTGKVAVVTGASKGIGAGIARALGAEGAAVVVNYASDKEGADRVVRAIVAEDGRAVAVQGDVAKIQDIRRLFAETKRAFGGLDVLVNNAGVFRFEAIDEVTEQEFHREFNINVLGSILAIQEGLKYFGPAGGSIINVSSVASTNPAPQSVVYSSTKAALDSVTRVLAVELGPRHIRVNSVNPGATETEGANDFGVFDTELGQRLLSDTPLGRFGQPHDIAPAVVFLASDAANWVTGETIRVSGGLK
jgi:3-oxoacyl-[acyl-carrier protein] reductase